MDANKRINVLMFFDFWDFVTSRKQLVLSLNDEQVIYFFKFRNQQISLISIYNQRIFLRLIFGNILESFETICTFR